MTICLVSLDKALPKHISYISKNQLMESTSNVLACVLVSSGAFKLETAYSVTFDKPASACLVFPLKTITTGRVL